MKKSSLWFGNSTSSKTKTTTSDSAGSDCNRTKRRKPGHAQQRRSFFEALEDRSLMATLYWDPDLTSAGNNYTTGVGLGGTGSWDTTAGAPQQWVDSNGVRSDWNNAANDSAVFWGTAGTVTLGTGITAASLEFKTTAYTVQSDALTLTGTATIDVDSGRTATISSIISGSAGLTKTDAGTLVLTNVSRDYNGETVISGGTLQADSAAALGNSTLIRFSGSGGAINTLHSANPTFSQGIAIDSGATGQLNAINQFYNLKFNGVVSGDGIL